MLSVKQKKDRKEEDKISFQKELHDVDFILILLKIYLFES